MMSKWDDRIPHNALVLGVLIPGSERAYPIELLRSERGVVNVAVDERPVVLFSYVEPGSYGALAFAQTSGDLVLTFEPGPDAPRDRETHPRWTYEGRAVEGPLAGTQLEFIPSHVAEWFIWVGHSPEIDLVTSFAHETPAD